MTTTEQPAVADRLSPRSLRRTAVALLFVAVMALSSWAYWWRLDAYPPYLDFDSATLGIFVNNLTFHDDYDFFFDRSPVDQDRYRANWAAHALPLTTALSGVQRTLGLPPHRVGDLLEGVTLAFGLLGSLCAVAAAGLLRRGRARWIEALFLVGFTAALPPFLLYLRTGVVLFPFFAFWLSVHLVERFVETRAARHAYPLGATLAACALVPYVPMLTLPAVGLLLALRRGALRRCLVSGHLYGAAALAAGLFVSLQYATAISHEPSYDAWRAKADAFLEERSRFAVSLAAFSVERLPEKATKLVHQHFYFRRDGIGDRGRNDNLWTLDAPSWSWLALLPFVAWGAWRGVRERDPASDVFAVVAATGYALAFTVGSTEGRYLLTIVPCYAYFLLFAIRTIVANATVRGAALAATMLVTSANSFALVSGGYEESMLRRWHAMGGMREALALIRAEHGGEYGRDRLVYLSWPGVRYEAWLYLQMLGNLRVAAFDGADNLAALAPGEPLFAAAEAGDEAAIRSWKGRGFSMLGRVTDRPSGREFAVLEFPP